MTQTVKNSDLSKVNFNLQFSFLYFKGGFNLGQVFVKFIWKEGFFSFRINTYFASIWENILIHQVLYVEWFPFSLKLSALKKNVCWMVGRGYFNWILIDFNCAYNMGTRNRSSLFALFVLTFWVETEFWKVCQLTVHHATLGLFIVWK